MEFRVFCVLESLVFSQIMVNSILGYFFTKVFQPMTQSPAGLVSPALGFPDEVLGSGAERRWVSQNGVDLQV